MIAFYSHKDSVDPMRHKNNIGYAECRHDQEDSDSISPHISMAKVHEKQEDLL